MKSLKESFLQFLIFVLIVLGVYFIFADFARFKLNTADASTYLNIAENIASHQGFVVSYNLYQFFTGLYHPIWPYMQSLYPLLCSFVFVLHGGIEQVIKLNVLILGINACLVLYIIQKFMPTRFNVLFLFFLVFSFNFFISALYAWTEQFHFLCFMLTFILFLKFKDRPGHLWCLGVLNGFCLLIRAAHLYNFLAYLPVILMGKGPLGQKLKRAFFFAGGFILVYVLYQLFSLMAYHAVYPEYARSGANYSIARFYAGIVYDLHKIGLQVPVEPFFTGQHFLYIGQHLRDFFRQMPLFFCLLYSIIFFRKNKKVEGEFIELCYFQSIFTILGYSLTFYWLTFSFDSLRYSMIPFVLLSVVGWYCLHQGLSLSGSLSKKIVGGVVLIILLSTPRLIDL